MDAVIYEKLLELPEVQQKSEDKKSTKAIYPKVELLVPQQKIIFDEVMTLVSSGKSGIYLMLGYAGTGKTFLTSMITEAILSSTRNRVAVTAPTNKAVKVLRKQSRLSDSTVNLRFSTIHSLLGLREHINGYGKQSFIKKREEDVKIGEYDVIIIDEGSMLPDELGLPIFEEYLERYNLKVIIVGDPAQIPPVGQENCIPFTKSGVEKYGIQVGKLTEVLRQSLGNPIIRITMKVREALGRPDTLPVRENEFNDENYHGVYFLTTGDKDNFYGLIERYFTSTNFEESADFVKILAWTNKAVNTFNAMVRKMIYGDKVAKLCVGEKLIADRPIQDPVEANSIIFNTNDEFEVVSFTVESGKYKNIELKYYMASVKTPEGFIKDIKVIHEDSADDYNLFTEYLVGLAKAERKGSWEAATKWKDVYRLKEVFAEVKYNYAVTAHKAQGSTYQNAFVLEEDIDRNRKVKEKNRIKYTAFTRPSDRLFIVK